LLLHWQRSTRQHIRSRMFPRNRIQRLRLCSLSIRCPGLAWTICFRLTRQQQIASPLWSNSPRSWVGLLPDVRPTRHLHRVDLGVEAVLGAEHGCLVPSCTQRCKVCVIRDSANCVVGAQPSRPIIMASNPRRLVQNHCSGFTNAQEFIRYSGGVVQT
jgi:hypothetical protein